MSELMIISQPTKDKIMVIRAIDPKHGALFVDDIELNAMIVAFTNTYEEAVQIIENLENN